MSKGNEILGLKRLRTNKDDKNPTYYCKNCGCKRYSPCGCTKKVGK